MVPEPMRAKRTKTMQALAPAGTAFCAGCQSFRDVEDFGKSATTCRACSSAKSHAARIEKVYGITSDDYDALLELQGGGCAVCGGKPKSKRLAIDHDHKTGEVRGLLCSRHNHDALGALADSLAMVASLWHYLNTPPASGTWAPLGKQSPLVADDGSAQRPPKPSKPVDALLVTNAGSGGHSPKGGPALPVSVEAGDCKLNHYLPTGSIRDERGHNWRVYVGDGDPPPF